MAKGLDLLPDGEDMRLPFRIAERWDMSGAFPIPLWDVNCPACASPDVQIRNMGFFTRAKAKRSHRCDVHFKCRDCSMVWLHGVVIPESMFSRHTYGRQGALYDWKVIRSILKPETSPGPKVTLESIARESQAQLEKGRK